MGKERIIELMAHTVTDIAQPIMKNCNIPEQQPESRQEDDDGQKRMPAAP